jgi:hypothetical protein
LRFQFPITEVPCAAVTAGEVGRLFQDDLGRLDESRPPSYDEKESFEVLS